MIDKQLLDRFLRNECSAEERRLVLEYLEAHPGEAAGILPEEEFEGVVAEGWDLERSERSFRRIQQQLGGRVRRMYLWSVAAAAVLVVAFGVRWMVSGSGKPAQAGQTARVAEEKEEWLTEVNNSSYARILTLPDGSTAELAPGSRIGYNRDFLKGDRRVVRLEGEGQFRVTDDNQRPFRVVSGELTTTVLGTWFSVVADPGAATIKVHLYSGRVRVGMSGGVQWKSKDPAYYLRPGEELIYNKENMVAVVRTERHTNAVARRGQQSPTLKPEWYMFGGQPLTEVFDQLSDYYGVQINYFPSDVKNRYFTGKFSKSDSLGDILSDIALLHGLTLTKTEGMYVFRKKDH